MTASSMSEELEKLSTLHAEAKLSDAEFAAAKRRIIDGVAHTAAMPNALQQLNRSLTDRWIGGVCGGLAATTAIPTWLWRILFVLAIFLNGVGLLIYLLMWIFVPLASPYRVTLNNSPTSPTPPNVSSTLR